MLPYYLLLFSASVAALMRPRHLSGVNINRTSFLLLSVFIGFRYQTGGDWWNYYDHMLTAYGIPLGAFIVGQAYEPLYALLNWFGANLFGGLVLVNSVCALIFSFSLFRFCRSQPNPWLALTLAIPYLVIVVAMGYTRQSVAIAFEMLALLAIQSGNSIRFVLLILIGSLFHRPVLALLALIVFSSQPLFIKLPYRVGQLVKLLFLLVAAFGVYSATSVEFLDFVSGYQGDYSDLSPQGAILRIGLTFVFSVVFLMYRKSFRLSIQEYRVWSGLSIFALVSVGALTIGLLPTAIDRLALYLLPIQLFVGSRLGGAHILGLKGQSWTFLLVIFSFLFLFIWLNFALNSQLWLPYNNILLA